MNIQEFIPYLVLAGLAVTVYYSPLAISLGLRKAPAKPAPTPAPAPMVAPAETVLQAREVDPADMLRRGIRGHMDRREREEQEAQLDDLLDALAGRKTEPKAPNA